MQPEPTNGTPTALDLDAIRRIVDDVQEGFNNDAPLMNAHVADDAIIVNARGVVLAGRPAIEKATEEGLAEGFLREATAYYELTDVVALSQEVITARTNAWSTQRDAQHGKPPEMNALYIFVHRGDRWLIWRRQNTIVG